MTSKDSKHLKKNETPNKTETIGLFQYLDCIRIPVATLEDGLAFYHKQLGHKILWRTETAIGLELHADKSEIVIHTEDHPLEIDFKVKSVPEAIIRIERAGGKVIIGPFDIDIGKCAVVQDPWKNQYIILDSSKGNYLVDDKQNVVGLSKKI